jgi:excisionase family DNA binding protein
MLTTEGSVMDQEFVPVRQAAKEIGIHHITLKRKIAEGLIAGYQTDADKRQLLVRREDLEQFAKPRRREEALAGAA